MSLLSHVRETTELLSSLLQGDQLLHIILDGGLTSTFFVTHLPFTHAIQDARQWFQKLGIRDSENPSILHELRVTNL